MDGIAETPVSQWVSAKKEQVALLGFSLIKLGDSVGSVTAVSKL
jgi:hypothetical protein